MYKILLVDDSETDRRLMSGLLEKDDNFAVDCCNDGRDALHFLGLNRPNVVVTDMLMPDMDGLQLVQEIRAKYPDLPVVLITAQGSESVAAKALKEGAAGYVPKSDCNKLLRETIHHVLELSQAATDYERLLEKATQNHFEFQLDNDPALIPPLQDLAQHMVGSMGICDATGCLQIGAALEHAVTNAMYHGNLELTSEELATVRGAEHARRCLLLAQRRNEEPYKNRKVHVTLHVTREEALFQVRDEGPGFDVRNASAAGLATSLRGGQGQGLFLMWAFTDKVAFDKTGNTVTLQKLRQSDKREDANGDGTQSPKANSVAGHAPSVLGRLIGKDDPSLTYSLERRRITVGRVDSCDIVIPSSTVSHHHCLLYLYDGWWYVKDLHSTNGTKVNHKPISEHLVRPGNILSIGALDFDIEYQPHELGAEGITPPVDPF